MHENEPSSLSLSLRRIIYAGALLTAIPFNFSLHSSAEDSAGPIVAVTGGRVQGALQTASPGALFKGIPFAQPPVGELRWREPHPLKPWTGIRQAVNYAATCAQGDSGWNRNSAAVSSEDCLYLNVWTPEWPSKSKKAVMVWIHGGGNGGGSALGAGGIEPPFDGASLASHGVVVVTIQYRLGLLGFMGHPELTAESPHHASGGYGLLDQVAALQWVHENIANFGGDSGNVTVFGQSAGAQDLSILVASPLSEGLIQKAIAESGSPMISDKRMQTPTQMEQLGVALATALKAPSTGAVAYMRNLPVAQILTASGELRKILADQHLIVDVGVDGYAAPSFSPATYRSGKEAPVLMMFGSNSREGGGQRPGAASPSRDEILAQTKNRINDFYAAYPDLQQRALKAYGFNGPENNLSKNPRYFGPEYQFGTDTFMRCETVAAAEWHSAVAPTYEYEFTAGNDAHPPVHSAELDFVFGYLRDQASDQHLSKLSEQMQQYWTNFAKTGDPNGPGLPKWSKYDSKARAYIELSNEGPEAKSDIQSVPCAIYVEKLNRDIDARMK